jgi:hypothetical protein
MKKNVKLPKANTRGYGSENHDTHRNSSISWDNWPEEEKLGRSR